MAIFMTVRAWPVWKLQANTLYIWQVADNGPSNLPQKCEKTLRTKVPPNTLIDKKTTLNPCRTAVCMPKITFWIRKRTNWVSKKKKLSLHKFGAKTSLPAADRSFFKMRAQHPDRNIYDRSGHIFARVRIDYEWPRECRVNTKMEHRTLAWVLVINERALGSFRYFVGTHWLKEAGEDWRVEERFVPLWMLAISRCKTRKFRRRALI